MVMLPALCATTTYVMVQVFFCDDTPLMLWNSNPVEVVGPARISRPSNDGGVKDPSSGLLVSRTNSTRNISPAVTMSGVFISKVWVSAARTVPKHDSVVSSRSMCLKNRVISYLKVLYGKTLVRAVLFSAVSQK